MRNGVMVLTVLAITACGSLKAQSDREKFDALCEQEAGLHVYRTVKADEIFDESDSCGDLCPITLVDSQAIQRIGFCSSKDFGPWKARQPPGCYVYEKGLKGDPECFTVLEGSFQIRINKDFFDKQCIKLMHLEEKFQYRLRASRDIDVLNKKSQSAIIKRHLDIFDSNKGDILLRKNHYSFVPKDYSGNIEVYSESCRNTYYQKGGVRAESLIDMVFY